MKFKIGDQVKYINLIGKIREVLIEKKQISLWVEFSDNKMAIFNSNGYLLKSDENEGEKYRLAKI